MISMDVVGDTAGQWTEATSALSAGLRGMGLTEYADSTDRFVATLDLLSGSMAIATSMKTILDTYNTWSAGKAVAETAANAALGPVGWAKIAVALGAAAFAGATLFSITNYTLRANLHNASEVTATTQMIGVIA